MSTTGSGQTPRGRRQRARAFVLLVAVALLLVISAMAFVQLAVVQQASIGSLRVGEEGAARAIAEGCLASASAALAQYRDGCRATDPPSCKLDGFLVGTLGDAPTVSVPAGGKPWGYYPRGDGACLIRIDDNPDEGVDAGLDQPEVDRDLALMVTVIGLHPVRNVPPADAYARAHARVTLRRTLSLKNSGSVALWSPRVDMSGVSRVCGSGGVSGEDIAITGASCACGPIVSPTPPTGIPTAGCACELAPDEDVRDGNTTYDACADVVMSADYEPRNPFSMPATPNILQHARWSDSTPGLGSPGVECRMFLERDGLVFIWDRLDKDPVDTSELGTLPGALAGATVFACAAGSVCADPDPERRDCGLYTKDPVEEPCEWKQFLSTPVLPVQCRANQTPCWKPLAHLGTSAQRASLEALINLWDNAFNGGSTTSDGATIANGNALRFRQDKRVFLTEHAFNDAADPFESLCGESFDTGGRSCDSCNGDDDVLRYDGGGGWTLTAAADNPTMPVPFQLFVDANRDLVIAGAGRNDNPEGRALFGSVVTNGTVTIRNGAKLAYVHTEWWPDRWVRTEGNPLDSLRTCRSLPLNSPPGTPGISAGSYSDRGYTPVLSADRCVFEDVGLLWGSADCNEAEWNGTGCIVGTVSSKSSGRTIHLHPSPGYYHQVVVGFLNDMRLGGSLRLNNSGGGIWAVGDVEMYGNATLIGSIEANGSITLRDRARVFGTRRLESQRAATDVIEVPW